MRLLRPLRLLVPLVAVGGALVVFLVFGFLAYQGGTGGGPASCPASATRAAVVTQSGAAQRGDTAATLSDEQRQNAATIIGVAQQKGAPPRAWLVALATAKQESDLRNITYGDRDSLGLFQQRPSQGWGSPAQVLDPVYSTTIFLDRLLQVPELGPAAGHRRRADRAALGVPRRLRQVGGAGRRPRLPARGRRGPGGVRAEHGDAARGRGAHRDPVRARRGRQALRVGGHRAQHLRLLRADPARVPGGRDRPASGVVQQFTAGGHVPVKQAQPGDLLFYATDPSDPATIHHVMLYMGDGQMVEAPYSGESVRVRPVPWGYSELVPLATRPGTTPNSRA